MKRIATGQVGQALSLDFQNVNTTEATLSCSYPMQSPRPIPPDPKRVTMKREQPTGFVATCRCGKVVGAMDCQRTRREDACQILGRWLADGCTIAPRFAGTWSVKVEQCVCEDA